MSDRTDPTTQFGRSAEDYLTSQVHADSSALQELVEMVKPNGGKVLDVGTGAGHMAFAIAPYVDEVVAFDLTQEMLGVVARESSAKGLNNISILQGDAQKMNLNEDEFDGVSCRVAAHHFPHVVSFVSEVRRVLKPGGWFLLVDTICPEDFSAAQMIDEIETLRDPSHIHNLMQSEWEELLMKNNFTVSATAIRRKNLNFDAWVTRMRVPEKDIETLRDLIENSSGEARLYLNPREIDGAFWFDLLEISLLSQ